jgi:hypothetical protein
VSSRHHRPPSEFDADGVPDPGDSDDANEGDMVPGDRPNASVDFGMTAYEERHGEGLAGRLSREESDESLDSAGIDPDDAETGAAVGRITEDDEGAHQDETAEVIGYDSDDIDGLSSEEAAMHLDPNS